MQRKIIPDIVKKQSVSSLKSNSTVFEAATLMTNSNVAAIVVLNEANKLVGIVTERDLTRRAIAKNLDPNKTPQSGSDACMLMM